MIPITPAEIRNILETTDRLGIHREAVTIPLAKEGEGSVRLLTGGRRIEITAPAGPALAAWLEKLPALLAELDLSRLKRIEAGES